MVDENLQFFLLTMISLPIKNTSIRVENLCESKWTLKAIAAQIFFNLEIWKWNKNNSGFQ